MKKILALFTAAAALTFTSAQAQTYSVIDLGPATWATGINNSGQVVGNIGQSYASMQGFITGPNGSGIALLGTLGGSASYAYGINDSGQAVGVSYTTSGDQRAFFTGPNGVGMTDLGAPNGGLATYAWGINSIGQVVGEWTGTNQTYAFVTGPNGTNMTLLGTVGNPTETCNCTTFGVDSSYGRGINSSGQVVGYSSNALGNIAYLTGANGLGMAPLPSPNGAAWARAVNDSGQVIGYMWSGPANDARAFITGPGGSGGMVDLGTLGGNESRALGINSTGRVVGYALDSTGAWRAFVTDTNGAGMVDLNSQVSLASAVLTDARGINDLGQIVANGANGHAYLLTPIPEPQTFALLLGGLAVVTWITRRRSASRKP